MTEENKPAPALKGRLLRGGVIAAAAVGSIALVGAMVQHAPRAAVTLTAASTSPGPGTGQAGGHRGARPGNPADRAEDEQVIATAIGISTTQLQSELQGGKTIAQVAQAHGVSVDKVVAAMVAAEAKEIDAKLSAGTITQAQADQMKQNLQQRVTGEVNGTRGHRGFGPGGGGRGHGGGTRSEDMDLVAKAIGITTTQLQSELQGGKTIAQVAQAHGVSVDTLISTWVTSETKEIDDQLAAGRFTQAQADQMKANVKQRVTDEVNGVRPTRPQGAPPAPPAQ